ncbi:MAG: lamin tail domain-containing protein [Candidatus Poribacteria bacterium]|nr:lamin tail domain-containing protein [Candidatus Poribacteria bacterium]
MKILIVERKIIVSIIFALTSFCFIAGTAYSEVSISEIMYGSEIRFSPKQWIEISNTGTEPIDLTGWTLTIQNVDSDDLLGPTTATINFRDATFDDAPRIWPNDFLLIVTSKTDDNSGDFMEDQIYDLRWREDLGISFWTTWLSAKGFYIKLTDKDGNVVDEAGNYDGTKTLWDLPYHFNRGRIRAGNRTSLIRRYANGVALDGKLKEGWVSAVDANLTGGQKTYYGDENDISSPGIFNINSTLPVVTQQPATPPVDNTGKTSPPVVVEQPTTPPVVTQQPPTSTTIVRLLPATVAAPAVGDELVFSLNIASGASVAGYEATLEFNKTAFRYVGSEIGDYLPAGAFFAPPIVEEGSVKLTATSLKGEVNGNGTLAKITFEVIAEDTFTLMLSDVLLADSKGMSTVPQVENAQISKAAADGLKGDVNGDGAVNVQDLVLVAASLWQKGQNAADINGDGIVNVIDLVLVAGALGTSAAAPSLHPQSLEMLTAADIQL